MRGRWSTGAVLATFLTVALTGCGADDGPLVAPEDPADICVTAGEDGQVVISLAGLRNTGSVPVEVALVSLVNSVDLDVVVPARAEPFEIATGEHAMDVTLELFAGSEGGKADAVRLHYNPRTEPELLTVDVDADLRVLPAGQSCDADPEA